jgi:hypothetical protein
MHVGSPRFIDSRHDLANTAGVNTQQWDARRGEIAGIGETLGHHSRKWGAQRRKRLGRRGDADSGACRQELCLGAFDTA